MPLGLRMQNDYSFFFDLKLHSLNIDKVLIFFVEHRVCENFFYFVFLSLCILLRNYKHKQKMAAVEGMLESVKIAASYSACYFCIKSVIS
jgi:hypothetical protein